MRRSTCPVVGVYSSATAGGMMIDEVGMVDWMYSEINRATSLSWVWMMDCGYWRGRGGKVQR